jgi:glucans biosynthesis protein
MRLHLTLALITIIALFVTLRAERRHHFTFSQVESIAASRAADPYVGLPDALALAPQLRTLSPQQDADIFPRETARLWRRKGLPFQIDFYHQLNSNPIPHVAPRIHVVDEKGAHDPLPYSPNLFNFYKVGTNPPQPFIFDPALPNNLGFAGFYVRYPDMAINSNPSSLDGFFSALGSDYFRAIAKNQVYGLSARGVSIDTALEYPPKLQEEFPVFTDWWLHQPDSNSTEVVLDAILDGPSVVGAYQFKIHPGTTTSVDITASLYFRRDVSLLGIDPFSSMYLFGENSFDHFNDTAHHEIHDSDGLLIQDAKDGWDWHPLSQSDDKRTGATGYQNQYYSFPEASPKGFGLLQRDRDYQHYQDNGNLYNVRPSAWVTPHEGFGKGEIHLIENASNDFNTDNVIMFWHPAEPIKAGDHKQFSYTIDFFTDDPSRPSLAYTKQTLINVPAPTPPPRALFAAEPKPAPSAGGAKPTGTATPDNKPAPPAPKELIGPPYFPQGTISVQFIVEFAGNGIENIPADQPPDLDLHFGQPSPYLYDKKVEKSSFDNSWRATFSIIPSKPMEEIDLSCSLKRDGKPLSETWNYTWHPGPPPKAK